MASAVHVYQKVVPVEFKALHVTISNKMAAVSVLFALSIWLTKLAEEATFGQLKH